MVLDRMTGVHDLDMGVLGLVELEMQGALVQLVLGYLGPLQGLAWCLILGVLALGLVFLPGLIAQGIGDLLALQVFFVLVIEFFLRC